MDDASGPSELIDRLEQALREDFGLRSASVQAQVLLADETLALARTAVARAAEEPESRDRSGSLIEGLERARSEQKAAAADLARIEGWRARTDAQRQLAVDVFCRDPGLGPARDPAWRPGRDPCTSTRSPVYLRGPSLRICDHFEPEIDLFIHDPGLGTLAMVQHVAAGPAAQIQAQVAGFVDRATYLRHLLLTAREQRGVDEQILSVELVLVHRAHDYDGDGHVDLLYEIGEILRDLAQETDCLHAIGVNVLAADPEGFSRSSLRRAFPWLLRDTRRWFEGLEQGALAEASEGEASATKRGDGCGPSFGPLRAVEVEEYRMPGERNVELHPDARLHLLHGHNGSGKSSLVEAIELMATGKVERLTGIEDYEHVIRNRWASRPARVRLRDAQGDERGFELNGEARPDALAPGSRAASFRLDQSVMDRLVRASDVDRAAELLGAFFADEAQVRERWHRARAEAEAAFSDLPVRVRRWFEHHQRERQELQEVVVEQLRGLANNRVEAALADALLPLPRAKLRPLAGQLEVFARFDAELERDGWVAADSPSWAELERTFRVLSTDLPARVRTLEGVLRTLERVGRWWMETEDEGFDDERTYAETLDEWLELRALSELASGQLRVARTLAAARADGWEPKRFDQAGAAAGLLTELSELDADVMADLERAQLQWSKRAAQLGRALHGVSGGTDKSTGARPLEAARARLDEDEVAQLDRFGYWWEPKERGPGLGARVRGAIEGEPGHAEVQSFAQARIGAQDWVSPIVEAAAQMLAPLRELGHSWADMEQPEGAQEELEHVQAPAREPTGEPTQALLDGPEISLGAGLRELGDDDDYANDPEPAVVSTDESEESEESQRAESSEDWDSDEDSDEGALEATERIPHADRLYDLQGQGPSRRRPVAKPLAQRGPAPRPAAIQSRGIRPPAPDPEPVKAREKRRAADFGLGEREHEHDQDHDHVHEQVQEDGVELGLSALLERLRQVEQLSARANAVGLEVQDSFVTRLATNDEQALGLIDALNELMALFTPARWAYEDVLLRYQEAGEHSRLRFETGEVLEDGQMQTRARADLRLNTAQLNAFTLVLFLLCAPRVPNPLGLLVLDDPLQNMDELTVTTLARGLAKLMRVLPTRWSLMMFFHGEGDLARFHDEVECAVYFLPWLSPTVRRQSSEVRHEVEDSRLGLSLQAIAGLVAPRPG